MGDSQGHIMQTGLRCLACSFGTTLLLLATNARATGPSHDPHLDSAATVTRIQSGGHSGLVRDLSLSSGAKQRVLYARPPSPRGTIVMLPGGTGDVGIDSDGDLDHGKNFVVRTRDMWLAHGYAVVIPDALDGRNMRGLRSSPDYARVIQDLVVFAHTEAPGPVFLLGTSQGSIAAMNGAAHLSTKQIAGVVLTESVSRQSKSGETVFDASPGRVTVPALIVANRDSRCRVAPAQDASRIAAAMNHAPEVKVLYVQGGVTQSSDCGSQSPHGYWGIESAVVDAIAAWLDAHA
jgi:pimeloyl-ACP methyl ester carboxylesterase